MSDTITTKPNKNENIYSALVHLSGAFVVFSFFVNFQIQDFLSLYGSIGLYLFILLLFIFLFNKSYKLFITSSKKVFNFQLLSLLVFLFIDLYSNVVFAFSKMIQFYPLAPLYIASKSLYEFSLFGMSIPFLSLRLFVVFNILLSIYGAFRAYQGKEFKYPLTFNFLK